MRSRFAAVFLGTTVVLASGCEGTEGFSFLQPDQSGETGVTSAEPAMIEREIEAPDVFEREARGLWDGRPSLGGVWVAHPDVDNPERVMIRNLDNGQFIVGALFRRERDQAGPPFQVSSDAAREIGMLAGQPTSLRVTALRTETVPDPSVPAPVPGEVVPGEEIEVEELDPVEAAAAAIDEAEAAENTDATEPPSRNAAPAELLSQPFVQAGVFQGEQNANNIAEALRFSGLNANVSEQSRFGQTSWRVLVGPAATEAERDQILATVQAQGFGSASIVEN